MAFSVPLLRVRHQVISRPLVLVRRYVRVSNASSEALDAAFVQRFQCVVVVNGSVEQQLAVMLILPLSTHPFSLPFPLPVSLFFSLSYFLLLLSSFIRSCTYRTTCVLATRRAAVAMGPLGKVNDACHAAGKQFVSCEVAGVFGRVFCDFGPAFTVSDANGEAGSSGIVASITQAPRALVSLLEDCRHGLETGDVVTLDGCGGMPSLAGRHFTVAPRTSTPCTSTLRHHLRNLQLCSSHLLLQHRLGHCACLLPAWREGGGAVFLSVREDFRVSLPPLPPLLPLPHPQVTVKDPYSFEIDVDTTAMGPYTTGGYMNQVASAPQYLGQMGAITRVVHEPSRAPIMYHFTYMGQGEGA